MKKSRLFYLLRFGGITGFGLSFLTACNNNAQQVVTITQESYEKISYQTVEVQRGNLKASVTLELNPEDYEEISYKVVKEEMQLEEVYVSVGDRVQKGDILVSFESEEISRRILEYEDEKKQKELLLEHYEKLTEIDKTMDYQADIKMLREDIQVSELYIEEAKNMLAQYQIVAKEDGIITELSDYLQNGIIKTGAKLLTEVCGTGRYQAVTTENDIFAVDEVYTATDGKTEYELRLLDMAEGTLTFEPVSEVSLLAGDDSLTLTVEKPEKKDVVYVNRNAVCTIESDDGGKETYCVYVMQENGYQRGVLVTPGECVGDNMIIIEGLKEGEKVVIR